MGVLLRSAHPPGSSLSLFCFLSLRPQTQTDTPIAKTHATAEGISAKKRKLFSPRHGFSLWLRTPQKHLDILVPFDCEQRGALLLPFYVSDYCSLTSYYSGCSLWLCSLHCTVYLLVLLISSSFFITSMSLITRGCFFCTTKAACVK